MGVASGPLLGENFSEAFEIKAISPTIGAVVKGLDLSKLRDTDSPTIDVLKDALLRHEVLFFEGQSLDPVQLKSFASRFGELFVHPIRPSLTGASGVMVLDDRLYDDGDKCAWRIDASFTSAPPRASLLYAHDVPAFGGDTLWSSMSAALDALSPSFRQYLASLDAEHDFALLFRRQKLATIDAFIERYCWSPGTYPPAVHPVVHRNPETGREALYVNSAFTTRLVGLADEESEALLALLRAHIEKPEFVIRWRWKQGDVAFWDNRTVQHYTLRDYLPHRRIMYRALLKGEAPVR